ncbi:hypothetical protein H6F89_17655 [Cyanobacteria bacterium FACHB-63]|nr:hypothetical protein [Cyanobacteria bacterium FACHB-63]
MTISCIVENPVVIDKQEIGEPDLLLDNEAEDLPNVYRLSSNEFAKLVPTKPGRSSLSEQQKQRVEVVADIFSGVFPDESEQWATDFSRDVDPEIEITVWENIAKAFVKIDQVKYLSNSQKKEASYLLLMRSMMTASIVLEKCKLKELTRRAAKEILRSYEANRVPLRMSFRRGRY